MALQTINNRTQYTQESFQRFIDALAYPPNKFQLAVLEAVAFGEGNLMVNAKAGSGKTSMLVMIAALIRNIEEVTGAKRSTVLPMAFNKTIRDEMSRKLKPYGIEAHNTNSIGNQAVGEWCKANGGRWHEVDGNKYKDLALTVLLEIIGKFYETHPTKDNPQPGMQSVYSIKYAVGTLAEMCLTAFITPENTDGIAWMSEHHNMDWKNATFEVRDRIYNEVVPEVLRRGQKLWEDHRIISFGEQLTLPVHYNMPLTPYDWVLIDEAQDLNLAQQILAKRSVKHDGRVIVVGDVNQAVYGFSGADDVAWYRLEKVFNAQVLDLNITYRCPTAVVDLARAIVPSIEARPDAPQGEVLNIGEDMVYERLKPDTLILARKNAPLAEMFFSLVKAKAAAGGTIPIQIIGRDVASVILKSLGALEKIKNFSFDGFPDALETYELMEKSRIDRVRSHTKREELTDELEDTLSVLELCYENFEATTIGEFKAKVKEVFGSTEADEQKRIEMREQSASICTAHKAKGLEADYVMLLKVEEFMKSREGQLPWQAQQERNLFYVAVTRAKKQLMVVDGTMPVQPTAFDAMAAQAAETRARNFALNAINNDSVPGVDTNALLGLKTAENAPQADPAPSDSQPNADEMQPSRPVPVGTGLDLSVPKDSKPQSDTSLRYGFGVGDVVALIERSSAFDDDETFTVERVEVTLLHVKSDKTNLYTTFPESRVELVRSASTQPTTNDDQPQPLPESSRKLLDTLRAGLADDQPEQPTTPPVQPALSARVKIAAGPNDAGAGHRGVMVARELIEQGLWDDVGEIWFHDAYKIHDAVFGVQKLPVTELVLKTQPDGLHVFLPSVDKPAQIPLFTPQPPAGNEQALVTAITSQLLAMNLEQLQAIQSLIETVANMKEVEGDYLPDTKSA